jgi:uncharacterized protein (TIGR00299 family) protein
MRVLVIDPFTGAAGDMVTAALISLGADREAVIRAMASVVAEPELTEVDRMGIRSLYLKTKATRVRRTPGEVTERVKDAVAPPEAVSMSLRVFDRLSRAEQEIHGETVHFHEVGADDAVAEVVGACTAYCSLSPDACVVLPVAVGGGRISGPHGTYPVPAPATLAILKASDLHVVIGTADDGELCTPTGAALLAEFANTRNPPGSGFSVTATGYGAGSRNPPRIPNVLRMMMMENQGGDAEDSVDLLETNIDDVEPEIIAYTSSRLYDEGAYDVSSFPCTMKKGRPGHLLRVVAPVDKSQALAALMAAELGTLGVRCIPAVHRYVAQRSSLDVPVQIGGLEQSVRVKIGSINGNIMSVKAEYDDVARLAERTSIPARTVARIVETRAWELVEKRC